MKNNTIKKIITAMADRLEVGTRADGTEYTSFKLEYIGNSDAYYNALSGIIQDADGGTDYAYTWVRQILDRLSDYVNDQNDDEIDLRDLDINEALDDMIPVYTSELTGWLASDNRNIGVVDETIAEYGPVTSVSDLLMASIGRCIISIADSLVGAIERLAEEEADEEEDEE